MTRIKHLIQSKKAQITILAAFTLIIVVSLFGLGIDVAYIYYRHYQLQKALDAGTLNAIMNFEMQSQRSNDQELVNTALAQAVMENAVKGNLSLMQKNFNSPDDPNGNFYNSLKVVCALKFNQEACNNAPGGCLDLSKLAPEEIADFQQEINIMNSDGPPRTSITAYGQAEMEINTLFAGIFGIPTIKIEASSCARRVRAMISLVLDTSASMNESKSPGEPRNIEKLKVAVKEFVDQFSEKLDYLSIVDFNTNGHVIVPMSRIENIQATTSGGNLLRGKEAVNYLVDGLSANGGTNLAEGLTRGRIELQRLEESRSNPKPFRAIVLFSDGAPSVITVPFIDRLENVPAHLKNADPSTGYNYTEYPAMPGWQSIPKTNANGIYTSSQGYLYNFAANTNENLYLFDPAADLTDKSINDVNPSCSSDQLVNLKASGRAHVNRDIRDCLDSMVYLDSMGNKQGEWITDRFLQGPGHVGTLFKELYHSSIQEADYALMDKITIYSIGLYKVPECGEQLGKEPCNTFCEKQENRNSEWCGTNNGGVIV